LITQYIATMKKYYGIALIFLLPLLSFSSCKKKKKEDEDKTTFQKADLLTNIGDNLIVPEYEALLLNVSDLETKYNTFTAEKTAQNLEDVKTAWKTAYKKWYAVNVYEFGPAMNVGLRSAVGTFPTDTNKVIANITAGGYNLGTAANTDAIGFSCLDFLLYRNDALNFFIASTEYTAYGLAVISKMKTEIQNVVTNWNSSYLATFKTSTGTESTSSFSLFVNEFNKTYELAKTAKLGIPIGKQSLGIQRPEYIEARMSAISLDLLYENVKALQRVYNGNSASGASGIGFDDYLIALERTTLANSIDAQFTAIVSDINALNLTLEQEMSLNPQSLDNLYVKMQNLVVSIKTDMSSAFGVLITYQDNDGD